MFLGTKSLITIWLQKLLYLLSVLIYLHMYTESCWTSGETRISSGQLKKPQPIVDCHNVCNINSTYEWFVSFGVSPSIWILFFCTHKAYMTLVKKLCHFFLNCCHSPRILLMSCAVSCLSFIRQSSPFFSFFFFLLLLFSSSSIFFYTRALTPMRTRAWWLVRM